ncbi:MAG TPA: CoB--CoM heterodisulfide reductase iron-sulfur subunit B family protein [Methanotrichaceae archaeon]|nr:CoB--CoM heterodisulfide reductase iron-sulfur subunit B family protein [Methanotrichaceae archaeon]HQF15626.1 CoB--CoM heterodisulfide reductase iron-sulfur subunit B family protein [Methanotrichaceae archaeon]HQI90362.1 CoB--CoM heterodisulfide reductase iron-sulfur subunit B family protein [Methanotrichaceae archaeon]HQJ28604.1 CoB--CoM heterodisulfide reductase iron-sulfur subunit B family protein [Methanotrichaceae archaeon]
MKLAYYPGCVARSTGKEYDLSTRAVAQALGVELEEISDWNCCGATHCSNQDLAVALSARNLARTGLPVMTSCSICYSNLRDAAIRLQDRTLRDRVNRVLEVKYQGSTIKHVLEVIMEGLEGEEGGKRVVVPLGGLRVAPYYGCLLTRPKGGIDSPEQPQVLESLIRRLGGEPVEFPLKMLCCGGPIFMPQDGATSESVLRILRSARQAGAEAVVAVCPLCHLMLDAKQRLAEAKSGEELGLPVLYVTQLAGIALGLGPDELGLEMNSVSALEVAEEIYRRMSGEQQC